MVSPQLDDLVSTLFNVRDFGAKGDGHYDDAPAFTVALAALSARGGGVLLVPAGTYRLASSPSFTDLEQVIIWRLPGVTTTGPGQLPASSGTNLNLDFMDLLGSRDLGVPPMAVTIASGAIARGESALTVDTEGGAATDDLATITGGRAGAWLLLGAAAPDRTVVVRHGSGNIRLSAGEDCALTAVEQHLLLVYHDAAWHEITRTAVVASALVSDRAYALGTATLNGQLVFAGTARTISAGAITATRSVHAVDTEGAAATDDLDTINGGQTGALLVLRAAHADRTVVVKPDTGNVGLDADYYLDSTAKHLLLLYDGSRWVAVARSHPMVRGHSYGAVLARQLGG